MYETIKRMIPAPLLDRLRGARDNMRNRRRTVEHVFTDIYAENKWGGEAGEFCSGRGSRDEQIIQPYVDAVARLAESEGFKGMRFVDLGCGDFNVGQRLLPLASHYVGADVVKPLIERNKEHFGSDTTTFVHLNMIEEALPDGDVCFIRQVLQHLSNDQIALVLKKLAKYRWVFVTEHYPHDNPDIVPNLDKDAGAHIRTERNSAVYLTEPPYSLPEATMTHVYDHADEKGVIRTILYKPEH